MSIATIAVVRSGSDPTLTVSLHAPTISPATSVFPMKPTPTHLGRYRIESLLGRGGMGEVYKAFDPSLDRIVALKTIRLDSDNPMFLDRLYREARACGRLRHPRIVTVHDLGEVEGVVFIAMEYLEGRSLAATIADGQLTFEHKIEILIQILDALHYAHGQGVIPRH